MTNEESYLATATMPELFHGTYDKEVRELIFPETERAKLLTNLTHVTIPHHETTDAKIVICKLLILKYQYGADMSNFRLNCPACHVYVNKQNPESLRQKDDYSCRGCPWREIYLDNSYSCEHYREHNTEAHSFPQAAEDETFISTRIAQLYTWLRHYKTRRSYEFNN